MKIPLTGLIIGGGFCDPESVCCPHLTIKWLTHILSWIYYQMFPAYADHMYNVGLLDEYQRDHMSAGFAEAVEKIRSKDLIGAFKV